MSEPQHPFGTDGTDSNAGRAAQGATPSPVQAVPDTLAAAGARLAQLRQAKGWAVEDVSARLKVSVAKLRELEAGDISHLPDATFAAGVVRAYAKLLGADPAPFAQALRRETGVAQPDLSMPASSGSDLPRGRVSLSLGGGGARAPRRRASWLWGIGIVVIAVIVISMWHTNSGESSAWFSRLKSIANGASTQSGTPSNVTQGEATSSDGASAVQGTDQANGGTGANASVDQSVAQQLAAPPPASAAPVAAVAAVNPASTPAAPAAASAAAAAQGASAASAVAAAGSSTFAIHATQDTWVNVRQKDGKEVFSGLVHGNDAREISGVEPLKVTVGNKAGIESMTINGQPVDPSKYASARGNVARFVLP